ncbi:lysozyme [Alteraurantiacibacter palmitatis]|uniref:Lysozyme n=1 Tax=Alteraurantiacibacter palmitatis TaxID=2054628 RepID=A0ABV7E3R7_9SPHN
MSGVVSGRAAGLVGSVLAALALAVATIAPWEGKRNEPYRDPIGILTVCYGETRVPMRRYTDAECTAMLESGAAGFMEGVRRRNPGIVEYPHQWAAHTSLAYNIGQSAYDRSSVARLFAEGRQVEACRFMNRFVYAGGKKLRGLERRRAAEVELCLKDAR